MLKWKLKNRIYVTYKFGIYSEKKSSLIVYQISYVKLGRADNNAELKSSSKNYWHSN